MPDSRQLANKLKSTPRMALRSKAMKNTPTSSSKMSIENNEELLNTIRGIIKEELEDHEKKMKQEYEEHEKKINDIIKSHLETTNKRLEEISKEVRDITESVEFTEGRLDNEIATVKDDISKMKSDVRLIERDLLDPNDVSEKLIELEDRSRRNNLRFDGLTEDTNETWDDCERKIQKILSDKLEITEDVEIERCHRMGKRKGNRPRTIVCKFLRFKDKQKILKNAKKLKNSGIYIYEDFCNDTMELRKSLWEEVMEHRRQGKFAFLNYRSIIVRNHNG